MARYVKDSDGNLICTAGGTRTWICTQAEHDHKVAAGTAPNNCVVAITDDYSESRDLQIYVQTFKPGAQTVAAGSNIEIDTGISPTEFPKILPVVTYAAYGMQLVNFYQKNTTSGSRYIMTLRNFGTSSINISDTDFVTLRYLG